MATSLDSYFDRTTAVTPRTTAGAPGTPGTTRYDVDLDDGWAVGAGVNGGYLLATIGRAIGTSLPGKPDPLSISAYYLSASLPGPATVEVDVRRDGGRVATASAELRQGDHTRITTLATFGDLDVDADDVRTTAVPFDLPPVEDCVSNAAAAADPGAPALMSRFDLRFHPDHIGWAVGQPNGRAELAAWIALEDGRDPDPLSLLLMLDALPPTLFSLGLMGWAPTIELTAHVRAKPAPGWLRVRHATSNIAGGLFEEDCEIWDSADRLVAQSRQLARLPR